MEIRQGKSGSALVDQLVDRLEQLAVQALFGDKRIDAKGDGGSPVGFGLHGRDQDDMHCRALLENLFGGVEAVHGGHGNIHDYDIRAQVMGEPYRASTISCLTDNVNRGILFQQAFGGFPHPPLIIDQHDPDRPRDVHSVGLGPFPLLTNQDPRAAAGHRVGRFNNEDRESRESPHRMHRAVQSTVGGSVAPEA